MNNYMLVGNEKLFAFSKKHGFTATFNNEEKVWEPSRVAYMALLAERDPRFVEISEHEAIIFTGGVSPDDYFERLAKNLKNAANNRR